MKNELFFLSNKQSPIIRTASMNGEDYLVFPVVAAKPAVMNDLYYSGDLLNATANLWNSVAVTISHPVLHGTSVMVNTPELENSYVVGKFYNARFEDNKLKGDVWLNIKLMNSKGHGELLKRIERGEVIDVSTAALGLLNNVAGVFNGKSYSGEVKNIYPNHLAILPNEAGACSVADGCGTMLLNAETKTSCCESCKEKTLQNEKNVLTSIEQPKKKVNRMKATTLNFIANAGLNLSEEEQTSIDALSDVNLTHLTNAVLKAKEVPVFTKEDVALLNSVKADREVKIPQMRAEVLANFAGTTEETVKNFDFNALQELCNSIKKVEQKPLVNYAGQAGAVLTNSDSGFKHVTAADAFKGVK